MMLTDVESVFNRLSLLCDCVGDCYDRDLRETRRWEEREGTAARFPPRSRRQTSR